MNPECPKCGARMIGPRLVRALNLERLKYVCTCGYVTTTPTRDSGAAAFRATQEQETKK